ncbi:MAG TPA: hypothetical protein VJ255_14225, partial [Candidatus Acidoferrum sp.]|nr:hypothetical protein [Candidatus Acidoferrum sp.]
MKMIATTDKRRTIVGWRTRTLCMNYILSGRGIPFQLLAPGIRRNRTSGSQYFLGRHRVHPNQAVYTEVAMPRYEFYCEDCKKPFELILSLAEYEKNK